MENMHTPGPLITHHQPLHMQSGYGTNDSIMTEDGDVVALIGLLSGTRADVRLWAAAPELLDALEGVLSAAEHAYHTAAFTDPDGGDWWERIKKARAAIAKSTGADQ